MINTVYEENVHKTDNLFPLNVVSKGEAHRAVAKDPHNTNVLSLMKL